MGMPLEMTEVTTDELYSALIQDEMDRQTSPCCANCSNFYYEYGGAFCKCFDYPMDNLADKCDEWR